MNEILLAVLAFAAAGVVPQKAPQTPLRELTFSVSPALPKYRFRFSWHEDAGIKVVESVEVFKGDSTEPLQTLDECEMGEPPAKPEEAGSWFKAEDLNFDGYSDILMQQWAGATGNEGYCVWLFDPGKEMFVFSQAYSDVIGNHRIDGKSKTFTTSSNGSALTFQTQTYAVRNGNPVLIADEKQDEARQGKCPYHWVQRKEKNGAMVITEEKWFDAEERPCTP